MSSKRHLISPYFEELLELDRIFQEGATLKNVAENMRSLMVFVAMFVLVAALFKTGGLGNQVFAVVWGMWTLFYTVLASIQSGALFLVAVATPMLRSRRPSSESDGFRKILFSLFTGLTFFLVAAVVKVLLKAIQLAPNT